MDLSTKYAAHLWNNGSTELFNWTDEGTSSPSNFSNSTGNQTEISEVDLARAIPLSMILGTFISSAVVGNILVILSVVCNKNLRTATNYFIVNLAIADLLLSSVVLPLSATLEILDYWVFGRIFCDIWAAMDVLCCTASIMSLCVISIDRYIGVSYPLRYQGIVTKKRALLAMLGVWCLSLVISIGPLLGWKQPSTHDDTVCLITEEPFYALFSSFCSFYIPLAVILTMYTRVYVVAKRTTKNLEAGVMKEANAGESSALRIHRGGRKPAAQEETADAGGTAKKQSSLSLKLMKFSREKKAAKTLGVVVGMFTLCWLPFFLSLPIGSFNADLRPPETVFKVLFWLGYFNSWMNPIIYPATNNEFKQAFLRILRCQFARKKCARWRDDGRCSYLRCSGSAEPQGRGRKGVPLQGKASQTSSSALLPGAPTHCMLKEGVGGKGNKGGTGGSEAGGGL